MTDGRTVYVNMPSLEIKKVDDHFAPQAENLDVTYEITKATGKRVKVAHVAEFQEANWRQERMMLISLVRRLGGDAPEGVNIKCYTMKAEGEPKATLTTLPEEQS